MAREEPQGLSGANESHRPASTHSGLQQPAGIQGNFSRGSRFPGKVSYPVSQLGLPYAYTRPKGLMTATSDVKVLVRDLEGPLSST